MSKFSFRVGSRKSGLIFILVALVATGCGSSSSSTPSPTSSVTAIVSPTPTKAPTATPTTQPTSTPAPTGTATVAPTATASATPAPTPIADTIIFSPPATTLITSATSSTFTINLAAYGANGALITPSSSNPFNLKVYGAPNGVITPATQTVSTGSAIFSYTGASFPNNITIDAWIGDPNSSLTGQQALGQTLVMLSGPPACASSSATYTVPLVSTLPNDLEFTGAVGYTNANIPVGNQNGFAIDTGSLGTLVTASSLPSSSASNAFLIGPGPTGAQCYTSSNKAFFGNYYLAPVDIQVNSSGGGTTFVQTTPILVLAINKYCPVTDCSTLTITDPSKCTINPSLYYLGVGFDRPGATPGNLFHSPAANAFLHITDASNGTDIAPGYVLTTKGATLGIDGTTGYKVIDLMPSTTTPGDWQTEQGCYSFPQLSGAPFCGNTFLDAGIGEMEIDAPMSQWPQGSNDPASNPANQVPTGTAMNVFIGNSSSPAISYSFSAIETPTAAPTPSGPTPEYVHWNDTGTGGEVSANVGRMPLNCYNYFYQGQCGEVGFAKIANPPASCANAN